ncbi:DUF1579 family protein [Catenuloplanes japonicus]|uniref:DUF1579 family protein n=1 Tax=Catenuloplanes japonicus TaxID=33876 RepID=UPI0005245ACF|nr:DUF1579 family protein [Catenuloplanes japonicus]
MNELEWFLGEWRGSGRFHPGPFGPGKPIDMTVVTTSEERGRWLMLRTEEAATAENPEPLTARYLWGADPAAGDFTADWFDSNGGHAVQRSGGWDGDTLVFLGTIAVGGRTAPLRDTFTRTGPDSYHHIGETNLGDGWIPIDEETFTRAPATR